jgi:sulfate/thiosulfate-binding protein
VTLLNVWDDLVKPGISVITPNPKTSGSARWNYLGAWGFEYLRTGKDEAKARDFIKRLYKNVPILDSGARGATTTFVERGIGDVLIDWENEILLGAKEPGPDKFDIVVPPTSILTEPTDSLVDKIARKHGTEAVASALRCVSNSSWKMAGSVRQSRPKSARTASASSSWSRATACSSGRGASSCFRTGYTDRLFAQLAGPG